MNNRYRTLDALRSQKTGTISRTLEILEQLSTECLNPLASSDKIYALMQEAQNSSSILSEFPEWMIAKAATKERNFSTVLLQVSACIKKLK